MNFSPISPARMENPILLNAAVMDASFFFLLKAFQLGWASFAFGAFTATSVIVPIIKKGIAFTFEITLRMLVLTLHAHC